MIAWQASHFRQLHRIATGILIAYWCALFVGTHIPNPERFLPPDVSDKTLHVLAYFGLTFLLLTRDALSKPFTFRRGVILWGAVLVYAALDELLQAIPALNRTADVGDWAADVCGAVLALGGFMICRAALVRCLGLPAAKANQSRPSAADAGVSEVPTVPKPADDETR
ncbi:MAG: hypothetical protein GXP27_10330 [Planctomycetes bacterium]|nr:hypothetical protein [Planctomycetota bacterium]